jgi:hypothetical protein
VRPEVGSVVLRDLPSQSYYLSPAKPLLVEENDLRLIDVGMLSKLPVGDSLAG